MSKEESPTLEYAEIPNMPHPKAVELVSNLRHHGNYTLGVLLTAIEAALGDGAQAKAVKAIVKREMFLLMDRNQGEVYESSGDQEPGLKPKEMWLDEEQNLQA